MGGGKCVVPDCNVNYANSNSNVHFFHFPILDRRRLLQWIVNTNRLDLKNLVLSQLANRVVCSRHFTDDSYMNSLKNKLKHNAVPTLNGAVNKPQVHIPEEIVSVKVKRKNFPYIYTYDYLANSMIDFTQPRIEHEQNNSVDEIYCNNNINEESTLSLTQSIPVPKSSKPNKVHIVENTTVTMPKLKAHIKPVNVKKCIIRKRRNSLLNDKLSAAENKLGQSLNATQCHIDENSHLQANGVTNVQVTHSPYKNNGVIKTAKKSVLFPQKPNSVILQKVETPLVNKTAATSPLIKSPVIKIVNSVKKPALEDDSSSFCTSSESRVSLTDTISHLQSEFKTIVMDAIENSALAQRVKENSKELRMLKQRNTRIKKRRISDKLYKSYKTESTQTIFKECTLKKNLFNEISKYLSSKTKDAVYSELFLSETLQPPKKRKQAKT